MGKNDDNGCFGVAHLSSSDSVHTPTPHMETHADSDERTKGDEYIEEVIYDMAISVPLPTSISTAVASDKDTSTASRFVNDVETNDCSDTETTITTAIEFVSEESLHISSQCSILNVDIDIRLEALAVSFKDKCHSDSFDQNQGSPVATSEPLNATLLPKRITSSPTSAMSAVSDNPKDTLCYADDDDDSEVFADVIYAPESHCRGVQGRPRSIRFSDEKEGTNLATIHLIPWTDEDDANWLPRLEKCRMEL